MVPYVLDPNRDRCLNYTNGTLDQGATSPFPYSDTSNFVAKRAGTGARQRRSPVIDPATGATLKCEPGWAMVQRQCYNVFPSSSLSLDQVTNQDSTGYHAFCQSLNVEEESDDDRDDDDLYGTTTTLSPGATPSGIPLNAVLARIENFEINAKVHELADYLTPYFDIVAANPKTYTPLCPPAMKRGCLQDTSIDSVNFGYPFIVRGKTRIKAADYINFAPKQPSGKDGKYDSVDKACVAMNRDGQWFDTSCKANLDADGVVCRAPPRSFPNVSTTVTSTTTTTTSTTTPIPECGPCDPCEIESGASTSTGGGEAGYDMYESPNGWVVTTGLRTYSNKNYYWISGLIDKSVSCRSKYSCRLSGSKKGSMMTSNEHTCYWLGAIKFPDPTWINIRLPNETYVDYILVDVHTRPSWNVTHFRIRSNRQDHTPSDINQQIALAGHPFDNTKVYCPNPIKINISMWITDIHIYDLRSTGPYVGLGEVRVYGHNPCRCAANAAIIPNVTSVTNPRDKAKGNGAGQDDPGGTSTVDDKDKAKENDDPTTVAVATALVAATCCCCCIPLIVFLFCAKGKSMVLTFAGVERGDMSAEDIAALERAAVALVIELAAECEGGADGRRSGWTEPATELRDDAGAKFETGGAKETKPGLVLECDVQCTTVLGDGNDEKEGNGVNSAMVSTVVNPTIAALTTPAGGQHNFPENMGVHGVQASSL